MAFLQTLTRRFQKQCETSENHWDEQLRTRYFKANFNQVFQTAQQILESDQSVKITTISKEHGEIAAELNSGLPVFLVMTIITVKPYQTAVDFHLSTERFSITGSGPAMKKEALRIYELLGQTHTLIGAGKSGNR